MTDKQFETYMKKKSEERSKRIQEVRKKERELRKKTEKDYSHLLSVLRSFRDYTFVVLKDSKGKPVTIYSDSSFLFVKILTEELETHYLMCGELLYTLFRTYQEN